MSSDGGQDVRADDLKSIGLFDRLSEEECGELARIAEVMEFAPGSTVVYQGKQCRNLWIVLEGECEVVRSQQNEQGIEDDVVLADIERNQAFGEMSFFHAAPHSASVRAKSRVRLLRLGRTKYEELIRGGSVAALKLAYNAVNVLAERLRRMDAWVAELLMEKEAGTVSTEWSVFRSKIMEEWNL